MALDQHAAGKEAEAPRLIVVNASGSNDAGSETVVRGALAALQPGIRLILVGQRDKVTAEIVRGNHEFREIDPNVCTREQAHAALQQSVGVVAGNNFLSAAPMAERGTADVLVSGGQTERLIAVVERRIGLLPYLKTPSIAVGAPRPGMPSQVVLDVGARPERTVESYVDRTVLGVELSRSRGVLKPRVGLANMGTEPKKGPAEVQEALKALIALAEEGVIDFADNVEGSDVGSEKIDVIVTDGYAGNLMLKLYEHQLRVIGGGVKGALRGALGFMGKLFVGNRMKRTFAPYRPEQQSGTDVVGLPLPVIAFHGAASELEVTNAVKRASEPLPDLSAASSLLEKAKDTLRRRKMLPESA